MVLQKKKIPRGIRNNNPLNIVKGTRWQGLRDEQTDARFCQFVSMAFGWRAALVIIRNYILGNNYSKMKFNTIAKIVRRWAPESENDTLSYIKRVSTAVGIHENEVIEWKNRRVICDIVKAMAYVETGVLFDVAQIESAYDLLQKK